MTRNAWTPPVACWRTSPSITGRSLRVCKLRFSNLCRPSFLCRPSLAKERGNPGFGRPWSRTDAYEWLRVGGAMRASNGAISIQIAPALDPDCAPLPSGGSRCPGAAHRPVRPGVQGLDRLEGGVADAVQVIEPSRSRRRWPSVAGCCRGLERAWSMVAVRPKVPARSASSPDRSVGAGAGSRSTRRMREPIKAFGVIVGGGRRTEEIG
jgi:hypothetical protein